MRVGWVHIIVFQKVQRSLFDGSPANYYRKMTGTRQTENAEWMLRYFKVLRIIPEKNPLLHVCFLPEKKAISERIFP